MADHLIVDCATGAVTVREDTPEDVADRAADAIAASVEANVEAATAARRADDLAAVAKAAGQDPTLAALLRLLGLAAPLAADAMGATL